MTDTQAKTSSRMASPERSGLRANVRHISVAALALFAFIVLAITATGYLAFHNYERVIEQQRLDELGGIAELKTGQIISWMTARKNDAQTLSDDALFAIAVEHWQQHGNAVGETGKLLAARLASLQKTYDADGDTSISLFDTHGRLLFSTIRDDTPIPPTEQMLLLDCMRTGRLILSDIHREVHRAGKVIEIDLAAPLSLGKGAQKHPVGVILFRINPYRFLFPLVQRWPTASASAETLLVRREGDEVVFLNELRHLKNAALALRLPLSRNELPASMAAQGQEGLVEGKDYRGVPVIAVLKQIPGTSWSMVAKIDKSEIYAPVNHLAFGMLLLMLAFIVTGGSGVAFWWSRKSGKFERERLIGQLDNLRKYANDIIVLLDSTGWVVDFNDRAVEAYGYSAEEFACLSLSDLLDFDQLLPLLEQLHQVDRMGALTSEAVHCRKDGSRFPVESSVRLVEIEGFRFYQTITRDITQRKLVEARLEAERSRMRTLLQTIPDMVWLKDAEGTYLNGNAQFERFFGAKEADIVGKSDYDFVDKELADFFRKKDLEAIAAGKPCINEEWVTYPDNGQHVLLETIKTPVRSEDGTLIGVMGIARDITAHKLAKERESSLRHVLDSTLDMIFIFRPGSLRFVYMNMGAIKTVGYSAEELLLMTPPDIYPLLPEAEFHKLIAPLLVDASRILRFETTHRCKSGADLPVEVQLQLVKDRDPESLFVAIVRDITERKRAEIDLRKQRQFMWQVIDTDPNQIFVKDAKGRFLLANQSLAASYGLTPHELVGRSQADVNRSPDEVEKYLEADRRVIEEGCVINLVEPLTLLGGEQRWFLTVKKPLMMPDGRSSVLGISVDITQQKISEMKLAASYRELQRLSLHLESVRADERARIALNLHDEMGATLVAIKMGVAWLASKLPADMAQLKAEAAHINELVTGGIHTMHQIVTELRPNLLADTGLAAAIKDYVKKFSQHTNIECTVTLRDDQLSLDADCSLTLFRILQEALNNSAKHAHARKVDIALMEKDETLTMVIRDDGIGFDTSIHKDKALGLLGIRERALMVGGKARISSTPGKGTRVSVNVPQSRQVKAAQTAASSTSSAGVES